MVTLNILIIFLSAYNYPHVWVQTTLKSLWFYTVASNHLWKWCTQGKPRTNQISARNHEKTDINRDKTTVMRKSCVADAMRLWNSAPKEDTSALSLSIANKLQNICENFTNITRHLWCLLFIFTLTIQYVHAFI